MASEVGTRPRTTGGAASRLHRAGGDRSAPRPRSRRASARPAPATRWRCRGPAPRCAPRPGRGRAGRPELFDLVERIRRRHDPAPGRWAIRRIGSAWTKIWPAWTGAAMEAVISAFALYFQLVNLAEALAARSGASAPRACRSRRGPGRLDRRGDRAAAGLGRTDADLDARSGRLRVTPVLTAHPTEARRRTILVALRRCGDLSAGWTTRD